MLPFSVDEGVAAMIRERHSRCDPGFCVSVSEIVDYERCDDDGRCIARDAGPLVWIGITEVDSFPMGLRFSFDGVEIFVDSFSLDELEGRRLVLGRPAWTTEEEPLPVVRAVDIRGGGVSEPAS